MYTELKQSSAKMRLGVVLILGFIFITVYFHNTHKKAVKMETAVSQACAPYYNKLFNSINNILQSIDDPGFPYSNEMQHTLARGITNSQIDSLQMLGSIRAIYSEISIEEFNTVWQGITTERLNYKSYEPNRSAFIKQLNQYTTWRDSICREAFGHKVDLGNWIGLPTDSLYLDDGLYREAALEKMQAIAKL